jgi:multisubunit Na+/H+ antiporter MnhB subunit
VSTPDGPLKRPQTLGGLVYLVVVAASLVGLGIVFAGAWRTGLAWIGAGLLLSAVTRLTLSERRAGMLRVRRKWSDVLMLSGAGVALIVLTIVVPNQPPT